MMSRKKREGKRYIGARVPVDLYDELAKVAEAENRSVSAQVVVFLSRGVEHLRSDVVSAT